MGTAESRAQVRVAVVGCGHWGKNLVRNFADLDALHTVCDTDTDRLVPFRDRYPYVELAAELEEVLGDDAVDAVAIATPARTHYELARRALQAGKHVFVEKPLAMTTRDGEELVALATRQDAVLMVGHLLRYHPAILELKRLVDDGTLGRLQYIYSNRLNLGRVRTEENILWSFAPHDISTILHLTEEMPTSVAARGATYVTQGVPDVTVTTLDFASAVRAHVFVSWLHPYREHKLVVVGDRRMAAFEDLGSGPRLSLFNSQVEWVRRAPVARSEDAEPVPIGSEEPLRAECEHFLECISSGSLPHTDGVEGLRVLRVLECCQRSIDEDGAVVRLGGGAEVPFFAHPSAVIDQPAEIGAGTSIWHFSHVMKGARIGRACNIGQNVFVASGVVVGDNVKIQNNVSLYTGVVLEDHVFCGPSAVFTNVANPRSEVPRKDEYQRTLVKEGASLGANCTIVCGHTIGRYAFVGAGAVVTRDVPDFGLVVGVPAERVGWMCRCGARLGRATGAGVEGDDAAAELARAAAREAARAATGEAARTAPGEAARAAIGETARSVAIEAAEELICSACSAKYAEKDGALTEVVTAGAAAP